LIGALEGAIRSVPPIDARWIFAGARNSVPVVAFGRPVMLKSIVVSGFGKDSVESSPTFAPPRLPPKGVTVPPLVPPQEHSVSSKVNT
jgi:hypothetical protein